MTIIQHNLDALIKDLIDSQKRIVTILTAYADRQDWRPKEGEWSLREIAAHLATAERECFLDRIQRISSGENPDLAYYQDTGRDFGDVDLIESLEKWQATRHEIIMLIRSLPDSAWKLTGNHAHRGPIDVADVLRITLEHDVEHLIVLKQDLNHF